MSNLMAVLVSYFNYHLKSVELTQEEADCLIELVKARVRK